VAYLPPTGPTLCQESVTGRGRAQKDASGPSPCSPNNFHGYCSEEGPLARGIQTDPSEHACNGFYVNDSHLLLMVVVGFVLRMVGVSEVLV
ncbi:uncharacterized protein METZ01_LOCUS25897, partial [marine metagenome]